MKHPVGSVAWWGELGERTRLQDLKKQQRAEEKAPGIWKALFFFIVLFGMSTILISYSDWAWITALVIAFLLTAGITVWTFASLFVDDPEGLILMGVLIVSEFCCVVYLRLHNPHGWLGKFLF